MHAVDLQSAWGWQDEIARRIASGPGTAWPEQFLAICALLRAISGAYRSLNLRWYVDPTAADIYRLWIGEFVPKDPDARCRSTEQGPGSVWTSGAERAHNRAGVKRTPQEIRACDSDGSCAEPILVKLVRDQIARARPDLATRKLVCVVPAFLAYKSEPVCVDLSHPSNGEPASRFDGLFVGLICDGREVPQDRWTWGCVRFDDAPANDVRASLPFSGIWGWLVAWGQSLTSRQPLEIVTDARVWEVLANIDRAQSAGLTRAADLDAAWFEWLKAANRSPWAGSAARTGLQTGATLACGIASTAGGIPGLVCAAFAAGADALFSLLPADAWAFGCDYDQWGRAMPSPLSAQIDRVNLPPDFAAPTPPQPALLRVAVPDPQPIFLAIPREVVSAAETTAVQSVKGASTASTAPTNQGASTAPMAPSSSGSNALLIGAAVVGALAWIRRGKR